jgi:hypothetical protein
MLNVEDINFMKLFRQSLAPYGIQIWSSSESLPEEVLQQLLRSEEDIEPDQPRAEELHPQQQIAELLQGEAAVKITHFLDGSPRTINVGFLLGANGISYPVALAHVGAASVAFDNGRWRETGFIDKHLVLASLKQGMGLDIELSGKWALEDPADQIARPIDVTDTVEMRGAAVRRARRRMRNCEKDLARDLSSESPNEWIATDGTLFDIEGYSDLKNIKIIGISKSFTLNPIVMKANRPERIGYLVGTLTELTIGWRSPVYKLTPEQGRPEKYTYMWFVRIHAPRQSPFSGIVKIELPPSDSFLNDINLRVETVNALSNYIFRLRTPYLYDNRRGESFIYPVYIAETLVKSKLNSVEKLKGIWESIQY